MNGRISYTVISVNFN